MEVIEKMSALTIDNLSERIVKRIQTNPEDMERVRLMIAQAFSDDDLGEPKEPNDKEKKYSILDFVGVARKKEFGPPLSEEEMKAWHDDIEASRNEWDAPR
jgi:hypothetical protein